MGSFPNYHQLGSMDCGPACLQSICDFYGRSYSLDYLREKCRITKLGVSLLGISDAAESIGFRTIAAKISFDQLKENQPLPCILHWKQNHFVVLYKIGKRNVYISDPAQGNVSYSIQDFLKNWLQENEVGIALLIEPGPYFLPNEKSTKTRLHGWGFLQVHIIKYKKYLLPLILGLILSSLLLLASPFLTQKMVDQGILKGDLNIVYLVLLGQLLLFVGGIFIETIRNWVLLKIGTKINVALMSDFFHKLFKLPIHFFDTHLLGDLIQRSEDHKKVERLLTIKSIHVFFAVINVVLFGSILVYYNLKIFLLFVSGSALAIFWVLLFLKQRARLDFQFFELNSEQQGKVIEYLDGVEEIKISNSGHQKRQVWEELQNRILLLKMKSLRLDQIQNMGFDFIMRLSTILLTVVTAKLVLEGSMSLGAMFAINIMVGMLSNPIYSFVDFIPAWQDANLALLRIHEVHNQKEEVESTEKDLPFVPANSSIVFKNVSFSYSGDREAAVLKHLDLEIEAGKITAIVGASGSGKTTLLKLLLRFYDPTEGEILINGARFNGYDIAQWREQCGVVMQGGKIFSDTITGNIALGQELDMEQVVMISALANLDDFVNSDLPMGYFTKIGEDGLQLSEGQKQRLLLARALYKNPNYLLLDEATSSLDAKNERSIMQSLQDFWQAKTAVIVAHRLSTVRHADKIIVLNKGEVVECGTHEELVIKRNFYFELVKEQLDLRK